MNFLIKLKSLVIFIIVSLLFSANCTLNAEESERDTPELILNDNSAEYPVLKNLFESGFFNGSGYTVLYPNSADGSNKEITGDQKIKLTSEKNPGNFDYISFNLFNDALRWKYNISWNVRANDETTLNSSVKTMMDFTRISNNSSVQDAFLNTPGLSGKIDRLNVGYRDEERATEVAGYDFTVRTGFSGTHRFVRTLSEILFLNSLGVANYWITKDENMEDWRYKYSWKDVKRRFKDGWILDSNAFRTNNLYHFYAGATYYQAARSNEYGVLASTAWTFAGSFIWEYAGEWREKTSGNDMIFTSFGGAVLGEALHQSSIYTEQCFNGSVYGTIIATLLDPMRIINRKLDQYLGGSYKVRIVFSNPAAQAIMEKNR